MGERLHLDGEWTGCWQCGGEGETAHCWEEWACDDPEGGCDECRERCDICHGRGGWYASDDGEPGAAAAERGGA
jgi:hypothetical protein